MLEALLLAVAAVLPSAPSATTANGALRARGVVIAGEVADVVGHRAGGIDLVAISSTTTSDRRLMLTTPEGAPPRPGPTIAGDVVAFDVCSDGVVFVDAAGLIDARGRRVIARAPLLGTADPSLLPSVDVCPGPDDERLLAVAGGLALARLGTAGPAPAGVDDAVRILRFPHRARAYSGQLQRGLRAERGYAEALSLYAPRLRSLDIDGDGDDDLVAQHEARLAVFRRVEGVLAPEPVVRDVAALVGARDDEDVRIRLDGGRAFVGVSAGAVPERTRLVVVDGPGGAPWSRVAREAAVDGMAIVLGAAGARPLVARIDTSLVALSGVVLSGRTSLVVEPAPHEAGDSALPLGAVADVRAGRMDGALPVVDIDFDGDGRVDLLDLGEPGRATLHRRDARGFTAAGTVDVPRFRNAVPLPALRAVALVSAASKGTSRVTLVTLAAGTAK